MTRATIQVPRPCAEDWARMTPTAQGRHCAACQHTVTDFTRRTDAEILALLRQAAGGRVCGRFRAEQLNRELVHAPAAAPRWRAWLLTAAALWGVPAAAQSLRPTHSGGPVPSANVPTTQQSAPAGVPDRLAAVSDTAKSIKLGEPAVDGAVQRVTGRVVDQATGEKIPGVTVVLQGSTIGTSTELDGSFVLEGPIPARAVLRLSSVGWVTKEVRVLDLNQPLTLRMDTQVLGGLIYMPAWYSPRGLWYRLRALPRRLTGRW